MAGYVHARLSGEDEALVRRLVRQTGASRSELLRRGLRMLAEQAAPPRSALAVALPLLDKAWKRRQRAAPRDLSTNPEHLRGFGS